MYTYIYIFIYYYTQIETIFYIHTQYIYTISMLYDTFLQYFGNILKKHFSSICAMDSMVEV